MVLSTLKDVAAFLEEVKGHKEKYISDAGRDQIRPENLKIHASRFGFSTPDELINEMKNEIKTLNKAIAILEKESDNG